MSAYTNDMELKDWEFEKLLLEEQHKKMLAAIKEVAKVLDKHEKSSADVARLITSNEKLMESFLNKLKEITTPNVALNPNINVNQDAVVAEIGKMTKELCEKLDKPVSAEPTVKEWQFTVVRNQGGTIQSITAKQK
jgi:DNA-binding Lrp family transcriptional regulator